MKKSYKLLWLMLPGVITLPLGLFAQEAGEDDEVFELSPFEVTGDDDIGYQATSTLAGTRLRTDLRDIGSSISIVNEELLNDTASTNLEDVLIFTPTPRSVAWVATSQDPWDPTPFRSSSVTIPPGVSPVSVVWPLLT